MSVCFESRSRPVEARPRTAAAHFDFPVHRIVLGHGVMIAGHLTNIAPPVGRRVNLIFAPHGIGGADGASARVLGRSATPRD